MLGISLLLFTLFFLNLEFLISIIYDSGSEHLHLFRLSIISAMFILGSTFMTTLIICNQKANTIMKTQIPLFFIGLAISIVEIIILRRGALGYIESMLILNILSFIGCTLINYNYFIFIFTFSYLKEPIFFSLPIIPNAVAVYIYQFSTG